MNKSFYVRTKHRFVRIEIDDILYALADGHHTKIVTENTEVSPFIMLGKLEMHLPKDRFFRVNRSTLVNLDRIIAFDKDNVLLKGIAFSFGNDHYRKFRDTITLIQQED